MSVQTMENPFAAPAEDQLRAPEYCGPLHFRGSMSEAEGVRVSQLIEGRKAATVSTSQLVWIAVAAVTTMGWFAADLINGGDVEDLLHVGLGLVAVVGMLAAVEHQQRRRQRLLARLQRDRQGVFTELAGQVTDQGIEYLIGEYPIRYRWEDFIGRRIDADAAVLFINAQKEVNFLAASLFDSLDAWETAKTTLRDSVPSLPKFPRLSSRKVSPRMQHIAAGVRALEAQAWEKALVEFDGALRFESVDAQALQGRAVAAVGLRDLELALAAIEDVVRLGEPDATTRRLRAAVMLMVDRWEDALQDLDWLRERGAVDADLLRDRGLALLKLGRCEDALMETSAAIALNPQDFVALNNRGATFLQLGRRREAIADLETAIRIEPTFERPQVLLAEARAGDAEAADG